MITKFLAGHVASPASVSLSFLTTLNPIQKFLVEVQDDIRPESFDTYLDGLYARQVPASPAFAL